MLEKDFKYFINRHDEFLSLYNGKYLVIKDESLVGVFDSEIDAYLDAVDKFALGTFLIQKCTPGNEAYTQTFHSRVTDAKFCVSTNAM